MVIDSAHCLRNIQWRASQHCDLPQINVGCDVGQQGVFQCELIVVHCVSLPAGEYGTGAPSRLFTGTLDPTGHESFSSLIEVRVAPHVFIDRNGQVEQFVPFDRPAWHAGASQWMNREGCNRFSLGIELEGTWESPFAEAQYDALLEVCTALCQRYPGLGPNAIVGHQEIAPGRKQDPGPYFEWPRLLVPLHRRLMRDSDQNNTNLTRGVME